MPSSDSTKLIPSGRTDRVRPAVPRVGGVGPGLVAGMMGAVLTASTLLAQPLPHVTGMVEVDLHSGWVGGDTCISGIPLQGDTATLVLNEFVRLTRITGVTHPAVAEEVEPGGGTVRHTFVGAVPRVDAASGLPVGDVCVTYGGRFPIHDIATGSYRSDDDSNVIAFNGRAVRARGVSRWYPTAFARDRGIALEAVTFDIEVACEQCDLIYVNGGRPTPGPRAVFRSDLPRELLLVAGDLPSLETESGMILGEAVAPDTATLFINRLGEIQKFLEDYIGVTYGEAPLVVRLDAVHRPRRGAIWGFFSDPALTLIGMDIAGFVRILEGPASPTRRAIVGFLSHELAHRYFGWEVGAASRHRDLFGEPFATFLELKTVRHFLGYDEYRTAVSALRERVFDLDEPASLDRASPDDLAAPSYRYAYAPLALLALEHSIGEVAMRRTLRLLVEAPSERRHVVDFESLLDIATEAGASAESLGYWRDVCLSQPIRENPCMRRIGAAD